MQEHLQGYVNTTKQNDLLKRAEEEEEKAKIAERRGRYYRDEVNMPSKHRPNIFIFGVDDLDNEDVISQVESTPTFQRTKELLKVISSGKSDNINANTEDNIKDKEDISGTITFA
jgi:cell division protein FtsZ